MKHLGDITKISGYEVPLTDIVCGGSPCQDLSVAGKRAGLAGERSGLFMEQIRIIKEMRERSKQIGLSNDDIRPRYMVWENVPGAFSSNKGEDFRAVLEETAKVVCEDAVIPEPPKGKWSNSGCIMGDGWSIAWRVHDAQFWGVPQRRKRISLVADFGGESAPEILFEREGVSGNTESSESTGETTSGTVRESVDPSSYTLKIRGGVDVDSKGKKAGKGPLVQTELSGTLGVSQDQTLITKVEDNPVYCLQGNGIDRADTAGCNGKGWRENECYTLNTIDRPAVCVGNGQVDQTKISDKVGALNCMHDQQAVMVYTTQACGDRENPSQSYQKDKAYTVPANPMSDRGQAVAVMGFNRERCGAVTSDEKMPTLQAAAGESGNNKPMVCYGIDTYNTSISKEKTMTISGAATDSHHIPCVMKNNEIGGATKQSEPCAQEITKE